MVESGETVEWRPPKDYSDRNGSSLNTISSIYGPAHPLTWPVVCRGHLMIPRWVDSIKVSKLRSLLRVDFRRRTAVASLNRSYLCVRPTGDKK